MLVALTDDWKNGGFGLYIHWPFCESKCPYCDFNSHVSQQIDHAVWRDAYLSELRRNAAETPGRILNAVFFGGGTPSLMKPDVVSEIITEIRRLWPSANDLEITLEANPSSVEAAKFRDFQQAGVNRISMGIQALNDADLRRLGRLHSAADATKAFDVARSIFDRVSFDLIYGRQDQTLQDWRTELKQALDMAVDHLSLYQLTIEPNTAFGDRYDRGKLSGLPDEDLGADLYELTQEICGENGMAAYEVSNHARDNAQSRHNLIYWRYGDYVGIGPGAHGRVTLDNTRWATECYSNPRKWLDGIDDATTEKPRIALSADDQANEFLLMGMRLRQGISLSRYEKIAGHPLSRKPLEKLTDLGLLKVAEDNLYVLDQGVIVLNAVLQELLAEQI